MRRPAPTGPTAALVALLLPAAAAFAVDHTNLDSGRPLRVEDAYPVAAGEFALEFGAGFAVERDRADRIFGTGELLYGALPNLQLGLGGFASTQPDDIEEDTKSGDLQLSGLYNFNQETMTLPAIAAKVTLNVPTGVDSSGLDAEFKAIFTKSIDAVSLHLNLAYEFLSGTSDGERDGRYEMALGASIPIGAPRSTRTTLLADIFLEEGARDGDAETLGAEVGVRFQATSRIVVDAGIGTEFAGDDRSPIFGVVGVSVAF